MTKIQNCDFLTPIGKYQMRIECLKDLDTLRMCCEYEDDLEMELFCRIKLDNRPSCFVWAEGEGMRCAAIEQCRDEEKENEEVTTAGENVQGEWRDCNEVSCEERLLFEQQQELQKLPESDEDGEKGYVGSEEEYEAEDRHLVRDERDPEEEQEDLLEGTATTP